MESKNYFELDIRRIEGDLVKAKRPSGFLARFLNVIGLWNNTREIHRLEGSLAQAITDYQELQSFDEDIDAMDSFLERSIELGGVQVLKETFIDLSFDGNAKYPDNWEEYRRTILARDNYRCQEASCDCRGPLQIHHIRPLSQGGGNQEHNLITLCAYHHALKHPNNPRMAKWLQPDFNWEHSL